MPSANHTSPRNISQEEFQKAIERAKKLSREAHQLATEKKSFDKNKLELESAMTHLIQQKSGFFNTLTNKFGSMSKYAKVAIGLLISVPLLLTGIFAHIGALVVTSILVGTSYGSHAAIIDHFHAKDQKTIENIKEVCQRVIGLLDKTISRLDEVIKKLESCLAVFTDQNQRLNVQVGTLKATISQLSTLVIQSEEKRELFFQRLDSFLQNKDASFDSIFDRFGKAEEQLVAVKAQLANANEQYEKLNSEHQRLLARQEQAIGRIEGLAHNRQGFFGQNTTGNQSSVTDAAAQQDLDGRSQFSL
jgi:predicted  nucleic acid-binding Zn-ribbon protein